jgi:hypothetical protein
VRWSIVLLVVAPMALVGVMLVIVFAAIKRAIDRAAAKLSGEGIELDSGPLTLTTRYRDFRTATMYSGGGINRVPARLVLTGKRLHILRCPQRYGIIERDALTHFTARVDGERLHLVAVDPPGATGTIDFRAPVPDPSTWVAALVAAGAKKSA